jgi:Ca2+:H+ antiporter
VYGRGQVYGWRLTGLDGCGTRQLYRTQFDGDLLMKSGSAGHVPLYGILLPIAGVLAWIIVGKTGVGFLAIFLAALLLGNVAAAVHHAEVIAQKLGEPYGTLILAVAVTVIEAGLIISIMLGSEPNPTLMRDSIHAVVMLVLHGLAGLCIVVGAIRHRQNEFRVEGANAFLAVLIPIAVLILIAPNYMISAPGPYYTPVQLLFVSAACLALYFAFLFIQTNWHRDFFLPVGHNGADGHELPSTQITLISLLLLLIALFAVVMLAKSLTPALEGSIATIGAPAALNGIVIATIVLLPEAIAALRAAADNRLQASLNLALGSGVASIALTVPAVAFVAWWIGQPLALGVSHGSAVLMALGFTVAIITYGTGRTNLLSGIVHLVLLAVFVFSVFAP